MTSLVSTDSELMHGGSSVRLLIGTDEAGYGPNLGPLVITATAWQIPADLKPEQLWRQFCRVLTNRPKTEERRLHVADSKEVFSVGRSLECLEVPVLAFLRTLQYATESIDTLGTAIAGNDFIDCYRDEIWNPCPGRSLPRDSQPELVNRWTDRLAAEMERREIRLLAVRSRIMFPREFNARTEAAGSKGAVLSSATLGLVRQLCDLFPDHPETDVICDKHGGRNRYDELIGTHFDDRFVFRLRESRESSVYRMGNTDFCFRTRAEELMPVALASMICKYVREVLMHQFNAFWSDRIPGLKPTQGYSRDAVRFRRDITESVRQLGVAEEIYWRSR